MPERSLIFDPKGFQLGYIENNLTFDLGGRQRCSYAKATGNLCDLNTGNVIGHVSLDGTFVGSSWIADELFGKPSGDARANHRARVQDARHRSRKASVQEPVNAGTQTTVPQRADTPAVPGDYSETGSNTSDLVAKDMHAQPSAAHQEPTKKAPGTTPSAAEDELFDRAISMIRSAFVKHSNP